MSAKSLFVLVYLGQRFAQSHDAGCGFFRSFANTLRYARGQGLGVLDYACFQFLVGKAAHIDAEGLRPPSQTTDYPLSIAAHLASPRPNIATAAKTTVDAIHLTLIVSSRS